jgi:hypothetical protein
MSVEEQAWASVTFDELRHKPALADLTAAADRDQPAASGSGPTKFRIELVKLTSPSYEAAQESLLRYRVIR